MRFVFFKRVSPLLINHSKRVVFFFFFFFFFRYCMYSSMGFKGLYTGLVAHFLLSLISFAVDKLFERISVFKKKISSKVKYKQYGVGMRVVLYLKSPIWSLSDKVKSRRDLADVWNAGTTRDVIRIKQSST